MGLEWSYHEIGNSKEGKKFKQRGLGIRKDLLEYTSYLRREWVQGGFFHLFISHVFVRSKETSFECSYRVMTTWCLRTLLWCIFDWRCKWFRWTNGLYHPILSLNYRFSFNRLRTALLMVVNVLFNNILTTSPEYVM